MKKLNYILFSGNIFWRWKAGAGLILIALLLFPSISNAELGSFNLKPVGNKEFYTFVKVFSEMRGPLRVEILKDSKTDFKNADPLKYLEKVKDDKDVKNILKENRLSWDQFNELIGNILLGYFSIQPNSTKAGLIRQLGDYGLTMTGDRIPPEYRELVAAVIKTKEGSTIAAMVLENIDLVPSENIELARKNKRKLDQLFYTRFWKDKL